MPKTILICGKICSGKTTYAHKIKAESRAALLPADEITLALFDESIGEKHDDIAAKFNAAPYPAK
ncbi:hypothetical protein FACS1894191_7040 [Clostridia bacterium]|nr:hypothetical protein FACS1894191_7040 [Clostridia bacterium]